MESISVDVINLLKFLLPGFMAAWIFYSLTSFSKPSQFERVVQALILTFIIQSVTSSIKLLFIFIGKNTTYNYGTWDTSTSVIWSMIIAIFTGLLFSYISHTDKLHCLLRKLNITKRTSYQCEWLKTSKWHNAPVTLTLKNGKRIHGWAREWSSSTESTGHVVLEKASWINKHTNKYNDLTSEFIMLKAIDIDFVEFYPQIHPPKKGKINEQTTDTSAK